MNPSILLVDDDATIRGLLAGNLKSAGYRVQSAGNVPEAKEQLRELRPDLVLLEWVLPGTCGLAFTRQLRGDQRTAEVPIIVVSGRSEEADLVAALECGADDYVAKPFSMRVLLARIKAVIRRRAPQLADEVVALAGLRLDPAARTVTADGREIVLWSTEFRLLHFFMTHPGRIFTRSRLLDEVWGDHVFVEERTVDVHIRRLRLALAASGHDALVETVRGMGYRFRAEPAPAHHSTVADLGRVRGLSTPLPRANAA
jgi:two-component system phosphate regulon response regulator PhoB